MADDKSKRDFRDRNKVSADDDCEVNLFAPQNNITPQADTRTDPQGCDRATLIEAAQALPER
jgi:hypothetical protein